MNATPGPWKIIGRSIYQTDEAGGREVVHGSGIKGRDSEERDRQDVIEEQEANARFIVTACNSHADLLEALKQISIKGSTGRELYAVMDEMREIARQAIRLTQETL